MHSTKIYTPFLLAAIVTADFSIWKTFEIDFPCVDGHCHPEIGLVTMTAAGPKDCNQDNMSGSWKDGNGKLINGQADTMVFNDGFCGYNGPYKCVKQKDGTWNCDDTKGGRKSHCKSKIGDDPKKFICHAGGITGVLGRDTTSYDESMACVGPIQCPPPPKRLRERREWPLI